MSVVTNIYAVLFYVATLVLVLGVGAKVASYARTPAPLKIPTMPAPLTKAGAAFRVGREVVIFESLFRSDKWLWLFAAMFHFGLLLVLLRHARYFVSSDFEPLWTLIVLVQPFGKYAAFAMVAGLLALLGRRFVLARVRYITQPSDVLMLLLLLGIGVTGACMTFVTHTDVVGVKSFFMGLMTLRWQPLPADPILLVHLACVAVLMMVFPISKLLHVPGIFFSPTRNQADDSRERRHLAPWAVRMDAERTN
ncbi:MAG: respiratory nitrate reductase subunit gamma [Alphaproteobacteria bacterium]|nr:respiratory nitrate reductase subunit gamma [Alphaproteobacteria bacterium]MBF0128888.1 respiratory nitrate reductase subunit gamma [Alphaproteobacteria bacterium]